MNNSGLGESWRKNVCNQLKQSIRGHIIVQHRQTDEAWTAIYVTQYGSEFVILFDLISREKSQ